MNGHISREVLAQPAKRAARVIGRARLDAVRAAYDSIDIDAADALHDLRVGLRRLRSWLRAFRPELDDTVRGKTRRRLRDLTHATNAARDIEVWIEWIGAQAGLSSRAKSGQRYVAKWLRLDGDRQRRKAMKRIHGRLPSLLAALEGELSTYTAAIPAEDADANEPTMAEAIVELIRSHHQRFVRRIDRVESTTDVGAIHRCRIAAKRLRYLLEALDDFPQATAATEQLVELQDSLGTVRDLRLFVDRIVERIGVIGMIEARRRAAKAVRVDTDDAPSPSLSRVRPGMLVLAKRARQESDDAFDAFRAAWDQPRLDAIARSLDALTDTLGPA
jgi:CHAD domain-containing protein